MADMMLGAQLFTVREFCKDNAGVAETFKKVAQIGYRSVQISGFGPAAEPKETAKALKDNGLIAGITHMHWNRFLNELDAVIAEHQMWGCQHAAIGSMPTPEYKTLDGIKRFADELAPIAAKLAAAGIDFSYHNHEVEFAKLSNGKLYLETLYETCPADQLKAEIDTFWVQTGGGDPVAWIRKYPGRQPVVHFKDMSMVFDPQTTVREQRMAPIGEGNLNWIRIIQACREVGVQFVMIEQDKCYGREPFECLASSYKFLRSMGLS